LSTSVRSACSNDTFGYNLWIDAPISALLILFSETSSLKSQMTSSGHFGSRTRNCRICVPTSPRPKIITLLISKLLFWDNVPFYYDKAFHFDSQQYTGII